MSDEHIPDDLITEEAVGSQELVGDGQRAKRTPGVVVWTTEADAMRIFATSDEATQSARHIKPFHYYVACRLVIEGGFHPDDVTPRPPFLVDERRGQKFLTFAPEAARGGEATILGGLKTKNVDVVVTKDGIGPTIAISCKGMTGALRNLTNRMEETIGEVTNLHITYPALVFGYLFLLRANRLVERVAGDAADVAKAENAIATSAMAQNDVVLQEDGSPVESLLRFDYALRGMTGRRSIRNDVSRYEAVALGLVDTAETLTPGRISADFPPSDSPIRLERFFATLYARYDERFVFAAPVLGRVTRRSLWAQTSQVFGLDGIARVLDYEPRVE
jgi:hypothetical protein